MKESEKLQLPNVTLCAMTSVQVRAAVKALEYSMRGIHFADVLLITDKKPLFLPKGIHYRHTSRLSGIDDFNYKCVYELGDYIERIVNNFKEQRTEGEQFRHWVVRAAEEDLQ